MRCDNTTGGLEDEQHESGRNHLLEMRIPVVQSDQDTITAEALKYGIRNVLLRVQLPRRCSPSIVFSDGLSKQLHNDSRSFRQTPARDQHDSLVILLRAFGGGATECV